jgi:tetratricopeptide (TPR) repeat protein
MPVLRIRGFMFGCLLIIGLKGYSQDTIPKLSSDSDSVWISFDSSWLNRWTIDSSIFGPISLFDYIYHNPEEEDQKRFKRYKRLIDKEPNSKNHKKYFSLACSLWELNKIAEAEKMFLAIVQSEGVFYTESYYHSSDVPGDITTNIYGYGSFTSNYKNYAAKYLTKIYLEQKQFDKALNYLEDAVNKYPVIYTCGTGSMMQRNEYDFLYAACYLGLNRNKELLDLLLPQCLERSDDMIIKAIKKSYTQTEIAAYLKEAENSINCSLDSFPSYAYQTTEISKGVEKTDTLEYYSGSATILLFGRLVDIPIPFPENDQHLTKEWFIKKYKESDLYIKLSAKEGAVENSTTGFTKD